ncbi:MAG TPA: OmpA family protein, partial [Pseudomonadales bacterium]
YVAVTLDVDSGGSYTIALVETAPGSMDFAGYLQGNLPGSNVVIPGGSTVTVRYDNYGDVADSDTANAPWLVAPVFLAGLLAERSALQAALPVQVSELYLSKQAQRSAVVGGDFLAWRLTLENTGTQLLTGLQLDDTLPQGFRYQGGSARLNGAVIADPAIAGNGRNLQFALPDMAAGERWTLSYVTEVTVTAAAGEAVNRAQAHSNTVQSNAVSATVQVEQPFYNDRAFLLGRVVAGSCGDDQAQGIAGVRIYMEDGTSVITDQHGRWHIEGVMPGTHVLQLDSDSLSARYRLQQCQDNTRQAGNAASRFVNVQGGTLWRENWYLQRDDSGIEDALEQQLTSEKQEDGTVRVNIDLAVGEHRLNQLASEIVVPPMLTLLENSVTLDGQPAGERLQQSGRVIFNRQQDDSSRVESEERQLYTFAHDVAEPFSRRRLSFLLQSDPDVQEQTRRTVLVDSSGQSARGERYAVRSANELVISSLQTRDNAITLRPRFASMAVQLGDADKAAIRQAVEPLRNKPSLFLRVTGHSDSQKIRYRADRAINDNYGLSYARAASVAHYLSELLDIDLANIEIQGKGPDQPIADNNTAEGRALNRRVTVEFSFSERVSDASLQVVNGDSGVLTSSGQQRLAATVQEAPAAPSLAAGFVNVDEGASFAQPVFSVTALLDSRLQPRLSLNGSDIPASRIGMKMSEPGSKLTRYTWVGIELERLGEHQLRLQGMDPFGNARFDQAVTIQRTGQIKTIRLLDADGNTADGKTPVQLRLLLLDEFGRAIRTRSELQLLQGTLQPLNASQNDNPLEARSQTVYVDGDGIARFEPVSTAGNYRIRLSADGSHSEELVIPVAPDLRDWILVGFAEGTLGYNTLKGNMQALSDEQEHLYSDGEAAFFARGQVKGEWLLTMAYDSRGKADDQPQSQAIDPQQWYVLYGDDTLRSHDAASRSKLYLRIEKADFYALYGDYDSGLSTTELARFQRRLTGAKTEWSTRHVSGSAFVAQTDQGFVRDDIAADGTSGLYRLSRAAIVPGSEQIRIEVRDRFTNEVLESRSLTRFLDYSLDYNDGTLYFREPVMVQDASFNPQRIVVEYEVESGMDELVAGGRVAVHDSEQKLVFGVTAVDDNTAGANGSLAGVDLTYRPDQANTLKAEFAGSRDDGLQGSSNDSAWLIEHSYSASALDTRLRLEETDGGFGLGQVAGDDDDMQKLLFSSRYRFSEQLALAADASHQKVPSTDNQRNVLEGRLEYQQPDWQLYSGLRHADDQVSGDSREASQLIVGGQRQLLDNRLSLSARGEAGVNGSSDNRDYPSLLSLGADYRLTSQISLFGSQAFFWGQDRRGQDTRVGVRATPWQGGTVSTDVSRAQDEYGPRLMAHAGLFQTLDLGGGWTADGGLDRAQTISDSGASSDSFDNRRPAATGSLGNDYTAVSAGAGYRDATWQWTNRIEYRHAEQDDKWNLMSGFRHRLDDSDSLAGRLLHFDQRLADGSRNRSSELDVSYSRRPLSDSWYWLNRSRLVFDTLQDGIGDLRGQRVINNTHVNLQPQPQHQLSLMYGARYVRDTIDAMRFTGYSDVWAGEYRYDISPRWDIGLRASVLSGWNSDVRRSSYGIMAGYSPVQDVWISLGYNFRGFYDEDFDGAESRVQGLVLDFRIKFDQHSAGRLLGGEAP